MVVLKCLGYLTAAVVVLTVLLFGFLFILTVGFAGGLIVSFIVAIVSLACGIKELCESKPEPKKRSAAP